MQDGLCFRSVSTYTRAKGFVFVYQLHFYQERVTFLKLWVALFEPWMIWMAFSFQNLQTSLRSALKISELWPGGRWRLKRVTQVTKIILRPGSTSINHPSIRVSDGLWFMSMSRGHSVESRWTDDSRMRTMTGCWWLEPWNFEWLSIQPGMSSSQLTFSPSFFRRVGWNHQPDDIFNLLVLSMEWMGLGVAGMILDSDEMDYARKFPTFSTSKSMIVCCLSRNNWSTHLKWSFIVHSLLIHQW